MALDAGWFTEIEINNGAAFSLDVRNKVHEETTPYQYLEVYETEHFGNLMVLDGFVMLTSRDNFIYHEMMTHPALFTHPTPRDVLIIGGGDCGTLLETLKHPEVQSVSMVEIDERVTRVSELYFPELCTANNNPRANIYFEDGIKWLAESKPESYDVIIVDSTDPIGPAEGLFGEPFYRDCRKALRSGGIIVHQSESPLYHTHLILEMHKAMRDAGYNKASTLTFPQCCYPSGWWSATMACKDSSLPGFRKDDAEQRDFKTRYYNAAIHSAALALPEYILEKFRNIQIPIITIRE